MKNVTAILSMLHEGAGPNSATRLFRSEPVLRWTLKRLLEKLGAGARANLPGLLRRPRKDSRAIRAGRPSAGMRVRPEAVVRLGVASALAGGLMLVVPRHAGMATVAGALVAWTVSTLVADLPYARRLVAELSHRGTP